MVFNKKFWYIALVIAVFLIGGWMGWELSCAVYASAPTLPSGNVSCQIKGDTLACDFGGFAEYSAGNYVGCSYDIQGEVLTLKVYYALFGSRGPMGINPILIQDERLREVTQVQFASLNETKPVEVEHIPEDP